MSVTRADRPEAWMPEVVAAREAIVSACRCLLRYSESQEIPGHLILRRDDKVVLIILGDIFKATARLETWERRYGVTQRAAGREDHGDA